MYEVNLLKDSQYEDAWYFKTKNELNQTIILEIYISENSIFKKNKRYYVTFYIQTKRKTGYRYLESTGKDGIKSLIWAKKCLKNFIDCNLKPNENIIIYADDSKRFKIYQYGLKSFNFDVDFINKRKCLIYRNNK